MQLPDKCKELFLEGITDVMFYPREECIIPVPFSMARVLYINNCSLPAEPTLRLATKTTQKLNIKLYTQKKLPTFLGIPQKIFRLTSYML